MRVPKISPMASWSGEGDSNPCLLPGREALYRLSYPRSWPEPLPRTIFDRFARAVEGGPDPIGRMSPEEMNQNQLLRVLVVDDNRDAADSLARLIRLMNHDARSLTEPAQALGTVARYRSDVVFLDLAMPGIDGPQLCRMLRATYGFEDLFIVALTGHGSLKDREQTRHAGFDAHLLKPASPELLFNRRLTSCARVGSASSHNLHSVRRRTAGHSGQRLRRGRYSPSRNR